MAWRGRGGRGHAAPLHPARCALAYQAVAALQRITRDVGLRLASESIEEAMRAVFHTDLKFHGEEGDAEEARTVAARGRCEGSGGFGGALETEEGQRGRGACDAERSVCACVTASVHLRQCCCCCCFHNVPHPLASLRHFEPSHVLAGGWPLRQVAAASAVGAPVVAAPGVRGRDGLRCALAGG